MVSISLLPPEFRQASLLRRRRTRLLVIGGVICLVLLAVLGFIVINKKAVSNQLSSHLAHQAMLEQQLEILAAYEKPYEELTALHGVVQEIIDGQINWPDLLHQLGSQIPYGLWLEDFKGSSGSKANDAITTMAISLRGYAGDYLQVSTFLDGLNEIPGLKDLKCHFVSDAGAGHRKVHFEITANAAVNELGIDVTEED